MTSRPGSDGGAEGSEAPRGASLSAAQLRAETERARSRLPRLSLRFATLTAVGLTVAAAAIALFVRSYATEQAQHAVRQHARYVAQAALGDQLRPSDLSRDVAGAREKELDEIFRSRVVLDGTVAALLAAPDGSVTFTTDARLAERAAAEPATMERALRRDALQSEITDEQIAGTSMKVLKVVVPVRFGRGDAAGALVIYEDYAPIAQSVRRSYIPIVAVLELVLLLLYVSMFPVLRRVTRSLRSQLHDTEHQALHDSLTGLPNRLLFRDRVELGLSWSRRTGNDLAVMLIDLDRFKEINDTLGHQAGDQLLHDLGARLRGVLRETDTLARLGGDEFGVVLPHDRDAHLVEVVERMQGALGEPFELQDLELSVGASMGIARYPRDGEDVDTLIKHADVAMYVAKERRGGYSFYESERDEHDASRLSLAGELRVALERDEIGLYYQPTVDLQSGEIACVEALARWSHPYRGLLGPSDFIPLATETGLIETLTMKVLDQALGQCRAWQDAGVDVCVAVNVDVRSLIDLRFPELVDELLRHWALPPSRLGLEITEATIVADPERVAIVAARLREIGVQLAIDDFGMGYSSLGHLQTLSLDELKIDRSFILRLAEDKSLRTIVKSIVGLGASLGLRVVAEGVEDKETLDALRKIKCRLAQGFYLGEPMPAEVVTARLADLQPGREAAVA